MGNFIDMTGWVMKEHGVPDSRLTVINQGLGINKEELLGIVYANVVNLLM